ncbi:hypothetical protein [Streptomyces sp. NPDC001851]|uniref:hypothetical protein n=1 Tax=Streptomyces sp. NPDC001851 TaxID=3154529 RepID=UPI003322E7A4
MAFWTAVCGDTAGWPRDPEQYRRDAMRDNHVGVLTVRNQWDSPPPLADGVYSAAPRACADRTVNACLGNGRLPARDVTREPSGRRSPGVTSRIVPAPPHTPRSPRC